MSIEPRREYRREDTQTAQDTQVPEQLSPQEYERMLAAGWRPRLVPPGTAGNTDALETALWNWLHGVKPD